VKELAANPTILVGEIAVVVVLSALFEQLEHWARRGLHRTGETGGRILNVLFKEITLLGFVCFLLFVSVHTGAIPQLDMDAVHGFESVRMMMFMVLLTLVAQAGSIWMGAQRITSAWGTYERTRSFGTNKDSLESRFVQAGFLRRVVDKKSRRGVMLMSTRPFSFGKTFLRRLVLLRHPLRKLIMWRAIRHEFLFPSLPGVARVPDPGLFSFEAYLRKRLGKVLLALITVDLRTWFSTLIWLGLVVYLCQHPLATVEAVHCVFAWFLVLCGFVVASLVEEDTYRLTPQVPLDVRMVLRLFSGDALQMLRRSKLPGWKEGSLSGRRFRPGLGDAEHRPSPKLDLPLAMRPPWQGACGTHFRAKTYIRWGRLINHFQAISVTSLVVSHMSRPPVSTREWTLYLLSWVAWPVMLFVIQPWLLRRLTLLISIESEKDERTVRKVSLETKDALLRDFQRLVQLAGFERGAEQKGEAWTKPGNPLWGRREKIQAVLLGNRIYQRLSEDDKLQIWAVHAGWDVNNTGAVEIREVKAMFTALGYSADPAQRAADSLTRMVDFDGSGKLNWMKFKALFCIATVNRPAAKTKEDLEYFFRDVDTDEDGLLSLFELANGFERMQISMKPDDVGNLLFLYFGVAKPKVSCAEFVEWVSANRMSALAGVSEYLE